MEVLFIVQCSLFIGHFEQGFRIEMTNEQRTLNDHG